MNPEKNPRDAPLKEVGWLITRDHTASPGPIETRVGWGQKRVHADETAESFDRPHRQTVFMDKSLTGHMIPEEIQVRWRSFCDDDPVYDGIVNIHWLFDDDDLSYNIDRFNATDVGANHVFYSVEDISDIADYLKMPRWKEFILGHKNIVHLGEQDRWVEIYG